MIKYKNEMIIKHFSFILQMSKKFNHKNHLQWTDMNAVAFVDFCMRIDMLFVPFSV